MTLAEPTKKPDLICINTYEHDGFLWQQLIWNNLKEDDKTHELTIHDLIDTDWE